MMISLFFPLIFLKPPLIISGFFSDPPSRDVDLSKENIIAPHLSQHISTTCQTHPWPYQSLVTGILSFIVVVPIYSSQLLRCSVNLFARSYGICQIKKFYISGNMQDKLQLYLAISWNSDDDKTSYNLFRCIKPLKKTKKMSKSKFSNPFYLLVNEPSVLRHMNNKK